MYVERVTRAHNGEAWIGWVTFSKTGRTAYFNGREYGRGGGGWYNEEGAFWVSGVKKRGSNRHRFGSGIIRVDRRAVPELLAVLGTKTLDPARYVVADAAPVTSALRREFHERANELLTPL